MDRFDAANPAGTDVNEGIADGPPPARTPLAPAPIEFLTAFAIVLWLLAWVVASAAHVSHSGTLSASWWIRMAGFWVGWIIASRVWISLAQTQKIPAWACGIDPEGRRASAWLLRRWWRHRQAAQPR